MLLLHSEIPHSLACFHRAAAASLWMREHQKLGRRDNHTTPLLLAMVMLEQWSSLQFYPTENVKQFGRLVFSSILLNMLKLQKSIFFLPVVFNIFSFFFFFFVSICTPGWAA